MIKHPISVLVFMIVSFGVQGLSHFVINERHFAGIDFMRAEPVLPLGFATMIIQGVIMSIAVARLSPGRATIKDGVQVALAFGLFLGVYIALAEPAKYAAPSITSWILVEGLASTIQFAIFGVLLGVIHRTLSR